MTTSELYGIDKPRLLRVETMWLCRSRNFDAYGRTPEFAYRYWEREVRSSLRTKFANKKAP